MESLPECLAEREFPVVMIVYARQIVETWKTCRAPEESPFYRTYGGAALDRSTSMRLAASLRSHPSAAEMSL